MSDNQQGSFVGGLALGMFAGAVGYFLFATKDGSKMRQKVESEWQEAKEFLAKDGIIKDKNASITELVSEWLDLPTTKKVAPKKKARSTSSTASSPKSETVKFKGV